LLDIDKAYRVAKDFTLHAPHQIKIISAEQTINTQLYSRLPMLYNPGLSVSTMPGSITVIDLLKWS
jgi:hypothetical protein